ncbi:MAG: prepilin-type N-terminal cleavage/methylation domain-containing protein [Candidatus Dormibacteraeota bacterium]|nr:prepilin-type N-terminal cleavage/methylation domain-containing protein [Candidatus Dormibacteraeota bacterium]
MSRRNASQRGFTLVELMIGMALFTVITIAMAGTFLIGTRTLTNEARKIAADTAVSHASFTLTRDLASATTVPTGTIAAGSTVTLTYGSPAVTVVYSVDSSSSLIRTVGGSALVAARGITSVVITATGCYETASIQPSATGAASVALNVSNRPGGCF